ncbi:MULTISPECIES: hypothetical protein [unclassified Actinobaculum]|uniref:hypothetical protein n=1 Tax=unclassified Actinobaculum TaxID=2609299 RepID=UPI000F740960|nr:MULTISPECIES: hypothetical protein [unclassified Actinobaculum]RTE49535.1 hypothetical protein EKN07_05645 [Actinobaculum sp. 352]
MFAAILIVLAVLAAVWTIYYLVFASSGRDVNSVVSDTVSALRSDGASVDDFEVRVRDAGVSDVFSSFPVDDDPYIRPEDIENEWSRMVTMERHATASMKAVSAPVFAKVSEAASAVLPSKRGEGEEPSGDLEPAEAAHAVQGNAAGDENAVAQTAADSVDNAPTGPRQAASGIDPLSDLVQDSHPLQPTWPKPSMQQRRSA